MSKNKNPKYVVRKSFDVSHITEFLIDEVREGNITWREAIEEAALTAVRDQWFEERFDSKDLIGMEIDTETGDCSWDMQEDYQLTY